MRPIGRQDRFVAAALGGVFLAAVWLAQGSVGVTRDEGYYFKAASEYSGWFKLLLSAPTEALSVGVIDRFWSYNHEHPALMKTLFAWSDLLFHRHLGWMGEITAMRLPGMLMGSLAVALTYLLGVGWRGRRVGLVAALLLAAQPRFFYHAQLACFDSAITALWLATALAWLYRDGLYGHLRLGLVFGWAIAVKHNAFFFPILLLLVFLWRQREELWRGLRPKGAAGAAGFALPPIPWWVLAMGLIGPLVFVAHWPYLWPDPMARIGAYFSFHLHHEHYPVRFFGNGLWEPPFPLIFPFMMWATTLSLPFVIALVGGIIEQLAGVLRSLWWGPSKAADRQVFLLLNCLLPLLLIAAPTVPIFGGTKHWMNALPFAALIAALFCEPIFVRLQARRWVLGAAVALIVIPAALTTMRTHPHNIGAYSGLLGGIRGAADQGMQRQFWGGAARGLLATLNSQAGRGARIFCDRTNKEAFEAYQRAGLLRSDLKFTMQIGRADQWLVFHQPDSDWVLSAVRSRSDTTLVAVEAVEGVPMVSLFRRKGPS
jgi:4-amino-4-deoxy-L-arabinose transferase-like glycosyltransferase